MTEAAHVVVTGLVQGVFFRASAKAKARELGLSGWCRNRPDGAVELVVEGERARVEKMIAWCRQGPPSARVDGVSVGWVDPAGLTSFEVRH
ncbi:acylphosphatase [bacterium]|nr:acylphosphatase [bacterium]